MPGKAAVLALLAGVALAMASVQDPIELLSKGEPVDWDAIADAEGIPKWARNLASDLELDSIHDVVPMSRDEFKREWAKGERFRRSLGKRLLSASAQVNKEVERERLGVIAKAKAAKAEKLGSAVNFLELQQQTDTDPRPQCSNIRDWFQDNDGYKCDDPNFRNAIDIGSEKYKFYQRIHVVKARSQSTWINQVKEEVNRETFIKNIGLMVTDANRHLNDLGIEVKAQIYYWSSDNFAPYKIGRKNNGKCINFKSYVHNLVKFGSSHFGTDTGHTVATEFCSDYSAAGFAYHPWWDGVGYGGWIGMDHTYINAASGTYPHEVGHSLGLYHTFEGVSDGSGGDEQVPDCAPCFEATGSDYRGDLCADTPPHFVDKDVVSQLIGTVCSIPSKEHCVACSADDQCSKRGKTESSANINNIMSYYSAHCTNKFTTCQKKRMLCWGARGVTQPAFRKQCKTQVDERYRCCKKTIMWWCQEYGTCTRKVDGWGDC